MTPNTLWSRSRRARRTGRRLFADAFPALESLEDRVLLSAEDVAGFTQDSAWRVGASDENNFEFTTLQQWSQAVAWLDPVTGDFNGDGIDDVAARTDTGQWWVGLNDGGEDDDDDDDDGAADGRLDTTLWTTWSPTAGWQDVIVGDFNGDGRDDIAGRTGEGTPTTPGQSQMGPLSEWWVALSQDDNRFVNQLWTFWSNTTTWQDVKAGDFTSDGNDDIVGRASDGSIWVARSQGDSHFVNEYWTTWDPTAGWQDTLVGDYNGDGDADLASRTALGQWWVALSENDNHFVNQAWTVWWEGAGWNNVVTGDFDDDGSDDVAGTTDAGQIWVALSRGDHFENQAWGFADPSLGLHNAVVGDFDDDDGDDIAAQSTAGGWYVAVSDDGDRFDTAFWGDDPVLYQRVFAGDFDDARD